MNTTLKSVLPLAVVEEPFRLLATPPGVIRRKFKDRHKGATCVIVGNGPSLNQTDLGLIGRHQSFAVNGIFYKTDETGYRPNYYVVEDSHVIRDNVDRIRAYRPQAEGARFFPSRFRSTLSGGPDTYFLNLNRGYYEERSEYFEFPRFSPDASKRVYCAHSVTLVNLQLAFLMGFTTVLLVGMDFNYTIPQSALVTGHVIESTEADPNHFHPDYFGKGKKWHDPKLDKVLRAYRLFKMMFEFDGRRILNATIGGKLEVFDRVKLEDAIS